MGGLLRLTPADRFTPCHEAFGRARGDFHAEGNSPSVPEENELLTLVIHFSFCYVVTKQVSGVLLRLAIRAPRKRWSSGAVRAPATFHTAMWISLRGCRGPTAALLVRKPAQQFRRSQLLMYS